MRVAPDGNNQAKIEHLMQMTATWYMAMKAGQITHDVTAFSLKLVVLKQITYPLVTTTFMEAECSTIIKPILAAGLPAMGVVWTLARVAGNLSSVSRRGDQPWTHVFYNFSCFWL